MVKGPTTTITEIRWSAPVENQTILAGEARELIAHSNKNGRSKINPNISRQVQADVFLDLIATYKDTDAIPSLTAARILQEFAEAGR